MTKKIKCTTPQAPDSMPVITLDKQGEAVVLTLEDRADPDVCVSFYLRKESALEIKKFIESVYEETTD